MVHGETAVPKPAPRPDPATRRLAGRAVAAMLAFVAGGGSAVAGDGDAPECSIRVLRPVVDDLGNRWKPGETLPVDIARDDAGAVSFCAHGGSCIARLVDGAEAVRLQRCHVGKSIDPTDRLLEPDHPKS